MKDEKKGSDGVRKSAFGRGRAWRVSLVVFVVFLVCVFLVSCMAGSGVLFAGGIFLDVTAENEERVTREWKTESELALRLSDTVAGTLSSMREIPAFTSAGTGAERTREGMLLGMLSDAYAAYVGNRSYIARAEEAYPNTNFLVLIPAADLEARAERIFGCGISHGDAGAFVYLDRVGMYTTAAPYLASRAQITPLKLVETENTYRMTFSLSGERYVATFEKPEKNENGECWRGLRRE